MRKYGDPPSKRNYFPIQTALFQGENGSFTLKGTSCQGLSGPDSKENVSTWAYGTFRGPYRQCNQQLCTKLCGGLHGWIEGRRRLTSRNRHGVLRGRVCLARTPDATACLSSKSRWRRNTHDQRRQTDFERLCFEVVIGSTAMLTVSHETLLTPKCNLRSS